MDISKVAWVPIAGIWARQTHPQVRGGEASGAAARWQSARWPAAYLSENEETAWAEFYRALAEAGVGPSDRMPRVMHRLTVELERVADLRTEKARRVLGLPRMSQTRRQWPAFQAVGDKLAAQGAQAIAYASAARTRATCLCVFEVGLKGLRPVGDSVWVPSPPPPPRGLRA
jgi:RES domain-containing protein